MMMIKIAGECMVAGLNHSANWLRIVAPIGISIAAFVVQNLSPLFQLLVVSPSSSGNRFVIDDRRRRHGSRAGAEAAPTAVRVLAHVEPGKRVARIESPTKNICDPMVTIRQFRRKTICNLP